MVLKFTVEQVDLVRRLRDTGIGVKDIEIIFNKLADLEASLRKTCDGPPPSERAREPQLTAREVDNSVEDEDYSSSSSDSSTPSSPMPANTTFGTNTGIGTPLNGTPGADCTTVGGASSPEGTQHPSRRFQFRFTEPQLSVLRRAFASNPYPEDEEKEAIADTCNIAAINAGDFAHTNVTSVMVHTWFSNRRKDATRMLKSNRIMKNSLPMTVSLLPHEALRRLTRQRERFSFDRGHLGILEGHYQRNSYPNQVEKEAIAEECNAYTGAHGLDRCGPMTATNVNYWFANRRKRDFHRVDMSSPSVVGNNNGNNNAASHSLWNADLSLGGHGRIGMVKEEPPDYEATPYDQEVLPENGGMSWNIELDGRGGVIPNGCVGNGALNGHGVMSMGTETGPYPVKTEEDRWQLPPGNLQLDWR
ncbi:homeobox-containing protein 1 [Ixodes scapularis]|uniref:homeobox-containing protein 1 n=1 Tax=Ixodes scapularis TaxID=6945 RepID=UPI0011253723|nr:homeobox-containing protein 1 [Ixodes scapularis]